MEKNLCEKEMIRSLLGADIEMKSLFWNEIPGFKPLNKYEDVRNEKYEDKFQ